MQGVSRWLATILAPVLLLQSCASPPPAPVDRRQEPPSEKINYHIVSKGETLFSIAWRYEKDLHKLAVVNNLSSYTIYPGQRLLLDTRGVAPSDRAAGEPSNAAGRIQQQRPVKTPPSRAKPPLQNSPAKPTGAAKGGNVSTWKWSWPVKGKIARRYNTRELFKGIDIHGLPGSAVTPAGPGVVVYSGDGLRGYGKLIIVRHNPIFLSAYAHNRKIFVKEGMAVKPGQKIAEVGGDPANVRRFYFEIRRDGKPVNPLNYLPK